MVGQEIVKSDFTVDCGSDDRASVCSLEVALHDLVKSPIAQNHRLQLQTFGPE